MDNWTQLKAWFLDYWCEIKLKINNRFSNLSYLSKTCFSCRFVLFSDHRTWPLIVQVNWFRTQCLIIKHNLMNSELEWVQFGWLTFIGLEIEVTQFKFCIWFCLIANPTRLNSMNWIFESSIDYAMLYLLTPSLLWPAPVACKLRDLLPLFLKYSAFLVKLTIFVSLHVCGSWTLVLLDIFGRLSLIGLEIEVTKSSVFDFVWLPICGLSSMNWIFESSIAYFSPDTFPFMVCSSPL